MDNQDNTGEYEEDIEAISSEQRPSPREGKVLIVDDDQNSSKLTGKLLEMADFNKDQIITASTLGEAKKALEGNQVGLVIADIELREGINVMNNGAELSPAAEKAGVPIIFNSSLDKDEAVHRKGIRRDANYIRKGPDASYELAETIRKLEADYQNTTGRQQNTA